MRTIAEIHHPRCRITILFWNQKYLVKLEQEGLEQTFKINEFDVTGEEELKKMINEDFIGSAIKRFEDMREDLNKLFVIPNS